MEGNSESMPLQKSTSPSHKKGVSITRSKTRIIPIRGVLCRGPCISAMQIAEYISCVRYRCWARGQLAGGGEQYAACTVSTLHVPIFITPNRFLSSIQAYPGAFSASTPLHFDVVGSGLDMVVQHRDDEACGVDWFKNLTQVLSRPHCPLKLST